MSSSLIRRFQEITIILGCRRIRKTHEKLSEVIKIVEKLELVKSEFGN